MSTSFSQYQNILDAASGDDIETKIEHLARHLPDIWCDEYEKVTFAEDYPYSSNELEIVSITLGSLTYMYDMGDVYDEGDPNNPRVESRVVATYGRSQSPKTKRDTSRMQGFLGPTNKYPHQNKETRYDKGHFIAHMSGGGLDINLFFQRRDINRGWSKRGKIFRKMERYCADNLGTFCFSRPIYNDRSWHPYSLEYGVLMKDGTFWLETFEN